MNFKYYLFKIKFDAININKLNSFPWHRKPRFAISNANRPKPAPGTNIEASFLLLNKQIKYLNVYWY